MDAKARLGRWVLIAVIVVTVLCELALAGLNLQAGRFRGAQVGRVLLTGWLLWQVWDGAAWARWLTAGLFLAAAVFAAVLGVASPAAAGRPEVVAVLVGMGGLCLTLGVGLASPWVGAYQAARRGSQTAEPLAAADPARGFVSDAPKLPGGGPGGPTD